MSQEYKVIVADTISDLETEVNAEINTGWEPIGNVSVGLLNKLYQAMVMPTIRNIKASDTRG